MKPDYEKMWNELKDAITKSGICGIDRRLQITLHDLDALEEKHTRWQPKVGGWVWENHYEMPVYVKRLSVKNEFWFYDQNDNARHFESVEPLESHLPILEYKGFKVGEKVVDRVGNIWTITRFDFQNGQDVWVHDENIGGVWLNHVQHLPPPEPKRYCPTCDISKYLDNAVKEYLKSREEPEG